MAGFEHEEKQASSGDPQSSDRFEGTKDYVGKTLGALNKYAAGIPAENLSRAGQVCDRPLSTEELATLVALPPFDPLDQQIEAATESCLFYSHAELLVNGPAAFGSLSEEIAEAQHEIEVNMFSWAPDSTGEKIANDLRSRAGKEPPVKITIRLDAVGAFFVGKKPSLGVILPELLSLGLDFGIADFASLLQDPNFMFQLPPEKRKKIEDAVSKIVQPRKIIEDNPVLKKLAETKNIDIIMEPSLFSSADHSKVWIFDGTTSVSGGMNIGDQYSGGWDGHGWGNQYPYHWKDYMIRTKNDPAALLYRENYFGNEHVMPSELIRVAEAYRNEIETQGDTISRIRVLRNAKQREITKTTFLLLEYMEHDALIEHAYIMDQRIVDLILKKAAQGKQIAIIRSQPEGASLEMANEKFVAQLQKQKNITIVYSPDILHSKAMQVDSHYSLIGSFNLSTASLDYHEEAAILAVGDSPLQRQIGVALKASLEESKALTARATIAPFEIPSALQELNVIKDVIRIARRISNYKKIGGNFEKLTLKEQADFLATVRGDIEILISYLRRLRGSKLRVGGRFRNFLRGKLTTIVEKIEAKTTGFYGTLGKLASSLGVIDDRLVTEAQQITSLCKEMSSELDQITDENLRAATNNAFINGFL